MATARANIERSSSDLANENIEMRSHGTEKFDSRLLQKEQRKQSINNYVNNILFKYQLDTQSMNPNQTRIEIDLEDHQPSRYERISAFRSFNATDRPNPEIHASKQPETLSNQADSNNNRTRVRGDSERSPDLEESLAELNLDPNPIVEQRQSDEKTYRQRVYLRQLQPPTPQPIEIQVQEVLIKPPSPKSPINVRIGRPEPRTPSPIVIKSAPPPPPATIDSNQEPIVFNKYVPAPKQPPRQIIIHRYPDLPPKPRPIVVEQWLPYKPAPKRIIKHSLPPEVRRTPPPPNNIIISYSKPRAVIEVELVRLPVIRVDPETYQQMSAQGQNSLVQNQMFQHEQKYFQENRSKAADKSESQIDWRI